MTTNERDPLAVRTPDHDLNPLFLERWSPRAFSEAPVDEEDVLSVLEAARWAPSGNNRQPWRFVVARTPEERAVFHSFINESNLLWCRRAPILILLLSATKTEDGSVLRTHAFDAGAAWGYLALEAVNRGLSAHAMGGFQADKAREALGIPEDYALHVVIALGYRGDPAALPPALQQREQPSQRRPVAESLYRGRYG